MKILHISDIHGDFGMLEIALNATLKGNPNYFDIVACSGDICSPIYTQQESVMLKALTESFYNLGKIGQLKNHQVETVIAEDDFSLIDFIIKLKESAANKPLNGLPEDYIALHNKALEMSKKNYQLFKGILEQFGQTPEKVVLVPGNWDVTTINDVLGESCLKPAELKEIKGLDDEQSLSFIGYGGSVEYLPGTIPEDLIIPFSGQEAFNSLISTNGQEDVAITHTPPLFMLKSRHNHNEPTENKYLRDYLYASKPTLMLCGHTHTNGFEITNTSLKSFSIVAGSGNLGGYRQFSDDNKFSGDYGFFNILEIDEENYVASIKTQQIVFPNGRGKSNKVQLASRKFIFNHEGNCKEV
ncbi:MAG TPA: metallophosphoesterase [Candidatus Paceibacterota bacterium]|nr:metallophosphoesterase [Candidatus Paceibacterota bacterium]